MNTETADDQKSRSNRDFFPIESGQAPHDKRTRGVIRSAHLEWLAEPGAPVDANLFSPNHIPITERRIMYTRFIKWGGIAGIAYPIMQLIAQGLIQVGGAEPAFTASSQEILEFFQNRDATLFTIGGYLSALSLVVFLWFLGALWRELRLAEGDPGWLSMIAIGAGLVTASAFNVGGWSLAIFRLNEGLDPQIAQLLFDEGNFNFANTWVSLGGMLLAAGIVFREAGTYPRWLGGGSILLAIGLILARALWTSQIAFLPYVLFWVWMIALGVYLLRHPKKLV